MKKACKLGFKILISCGLLSILLLHTDIPNILRLFQQYSLLTLVIAMLSSLTAAFISAVKWHVLLPSYRFKTIVMISFIRNFYTVFFLGQVTGDVMRIYMLQRRDPQALALITASVFIDRMTGFLSLSLVGCYGLWQTQHPTPKILLWLVTGILIISTGVLFSLWGGNFTTRLLRIGTQWNTSNPFLMTIRRYATTFITALRSYSHNMTAIMFSIGYGLILQLFCITATSVLARGLGLNIPFADWCWIFWTTTIILFIPISISGLGVREGSFVGLLSLFGIPSEKAIALSFSVFSLQIILGILGGLLEFKRQLR